MKIHIRTININNVKKDDRARISNPLKLRYNEYFYQSGHTVDSEVVPDVGSSYVIDDKDNKTVKEYRVIKVIYAVNDEGIIDRCDLILLEVE